MARALYDRARVARNAQRIESINMPAFDLDLIGRKTPLFVKDFADAQPAMSAFFDGARILVVGGAGSIGQEVVKLLARYNVSALHVVDISENNLTELTRDFRSSIGYIDGETKFLPLDANHHAFDAYLDAQEPFDIVLNFSALKHVRSEKDPWSLMRMTETNVMIAKKLLDYADRVSAKKYFCVSTDKAQNPANLMGASKRVMECFLSTGEHRKGSAPVSTARFANVAFSDGSLLYGFQRRLEKRQPLAAPSDIRRYFVSGEEAGQLCLFSIAMGNDQEIFFPRLDEEKETESFANVARKFLKARNIEPMECANEDEARAAVETCGAHKWPCLFFESDTTGEKPMEEFFADKDDIDWDRFEDLGVIRGIPTADKETLDLFEKRLAEMKEKGAWEKQALTTAIEDVLPDFTHEDKGKYLDEKM